MLCHGVFLQRLYNFICHMVAVPMGFQSEEMIWVYAIFPVVRNASATFRHMHHDR